MKEFDIELAKQGHPVCTRDGRKVRILCYDALTGDAESCLPIVALVLEKDETETDVETVYRYREDGKYYSDEKSYCDLMLETVKHEGWVNIYKTDDEEFVTSKIFPTRFDAEISKTNARYVTTVKIEFEV